MHFRTIGAATIALAISQVVEGFVPPAVFENTAYTQNYDVSGSYIRKSISLSVKNIDSEPQSEYFFAVTDKEFDNTAIVEGKVVSTNAILKLEESEEWVDEEHGLVYYKVTLPTDLEPGSNINLLLAHAVVDSATPLPEEASQNERQLMVLHTSKYAPSAYDTKSMSTRIKTRGGTLTEITAEEDDIFQVDNYLSIWGPYQDVEAFSVRPLSYRYEYAAPLPKVTKLERDIWVSHWGSSISFQETYWLKNVGTKLKGAFSRLDFQKSFGGISSLNTAAIRDIRLFLPSGARDVYYTDLVGNVSTSRFLQGGGPDSTDLEVKPRYPVFGGWVYNFTVGWSNDADQFLRRISGDDYLLKVPFLEGPGDISYGEVHVSVILPEGATNIEVVPPGGSPIEHSETFSYLDTVGRPTVKLSYKNLVDSHRRGYIYVSYKYSKLDSLRKPLTIAGTFALVFVVALIVSKVNLKIQTPNTSKKTTTTVDK